MPEDQTLDVLILAAHDDDIICTTGLILDNPNINWHIAVLSNGDAHAFGGLTKELYEKERQKELICFLDGLTIPEKRRHHFAKDNASFSETELHLALKNYSRSEIIDNLYHSLYSDMHTLLTKINPSIMITPAYQGGNVTHDIINMIAHMLVTHDTKENGQKVELIENANFELYTPVLQKEIKEYLEQAKIRLEKGETPIKLISNFFNLTGGGETYDNPQLGIKNSIHFLTEPTYKRKLQLIEIFKSQMQRTIRPIMENTKGVSPGLLYVEQFRKVPSDRDYSIQPHEGIVGYTLIDFIRNFNYGLIASKNRVNGADHDYKEPITFEHFQRACQSISDIEIL